MKMTHNDIHTTIFTAVLFIIARTWKQARYLLPDEWIKKLQDTYTMYIIHVLHKKEMNLSWF